MKRTVAYLVIIISVIAIISVLTKKEKVNIKYEEISFEKVSISETKRKRYEELINIPEVSSLIRSLPSIFDRYELTLDGVIKYSYMYAYSFKDDIEEYEKRENNKIYVDSKYMENIIYELFAQKIDLDYYKEENKYVVVSTNELITDATDLELKEILYNEKMDIYMIIVKEYNSLIKIIYKYENEKYTLLWGVSEK